MKASIIDGSPFWQDHGWYRWNGESPVFDLEPGPHEGWYTARAFGYGLMTHEHGKGAYGNGSIFIEAKYLVFQ